MALRGVFPQGLAEALKDELAAWEESGDLEMLISLAIRLDNDLRERRRQGARDWPVRSSESASGSGSVGERFLFCANPQINWSTRRVSWSVGQLPSLSTHPHAWWFGLCQES